VQRTSLFRALPFLLALSPFCATAQEGIRLKVRTVRPGAVRVPEPGHRHLLVQFQRYPGRDVRDALARRGIRITGYVPDNTLMVSAGPEADLGGFGVKWTGPLETANKLSPRLQTAPGSAYLVIFHEDADMDAARKLVRDAGFDLIENAAMLPNHLLVSGSYAQLTRLAEADAVAYIMPASSDLVAGHAVGGCAGAVTEAGPVAEYAEVGTGWSKDSAGVVSLQYFFQSLTEKMDEATVRSEVERAFREWERYAPVQLTPGQRADAARTIAILFARGAHGDAYPFDGMGGTLAHTFYPSPPNTEPVAGDMHLDADEAWGMGTGVDLYSVVLHETGHALGLGHSDNPGAVMYPYYRVTGGLAADDVAGIRGLYGSGQPEAPGAPPSAPSAPDVPTVPATPSGPPANPATPPAQPPSADRIPPSITITSPASTIVSTSAAAITVSGRAGDNVGVASVRWTTSNGDAGAASGTTVWSAGIPLLVGTNVVTVRAYDAAGNVSWRSVTVVRR
jgi:Matrixin/Glucodextranase, domain B